MPLLMNSFLESHKKMPERTIIWVFDYSLTHVATCQSWLIPSLIYNMTFLRIQWSYLFCKSWWASIFNSLAQRPRTTNTGSRPWTPEKIWQVRICSMDNTWQGGVLSKASRLLSSETPIFRDRAVLSDIGRTSSTWRPNDLLRDEVRKTPGSFNCFKRKDRGKGKEKLHACFSLLSLVKDLLCKDVPFWDGVLNLINTILVKSQQEVDGTGE